MTEQPGDPRLEDELRKVLGRRDPGPAPSVLRSWVQDVPEEAAPHQPYQLRRPFAAALGLAAVILLAVIGLATIRHIGPGVSGASAPGSPGPSPSPAASPVAAFDPTVEGPGISATDDFSPAIPVVLACAVLGALAMTLRGWRRILPATLAAALAGWAAVGALMPATVGVNGYGQGLNTVMAASPLGSDERLIYVVAPANGRFSVGLLFLPSGPLPIRIEGIVEPLFGRDPQSFASAMMRTAIWIDGEPNGGMTGPIRPFAPFDMSRNGQAIWIVGRASACALGSAFDLSNPITVGGYQTIDSLDLRVSVLGWPRTLHLALPFRLVEPEPESCSLPNPETSASPSAQP